MYSTVIAATAYFADRLHETAWSASSNEDRRRALIAATRIIDTMGYKGTKASVYAAVLANPDASDAEIRAAEASQEHEFPRGADTDVPHDVLTACYEIAYALLDGVDPQMELENLGVSSQGIESVRTSYARAGKPIEHIINGVPSYTAWRYLRPFLRDGDTINLRRVN